jgi:trk system potassium uptake protein TrkA
MAQRFIILGAGRFGAYLAARLSEFGCEVAIADRNTARVKDLAEDGYHIVEADAEDEEALKELGVQDADAVIVSIGENMQGSILSTLALKQLNVSRIVARALDAKHAQVLQKVGADLVILPSRDIAYKLAEQLRNDTATERQPISGEYQLGHIRLGDLLNGKTLAEASIRKDYKINVVLLLRENSAQTIEPTPELLLKSGDVIICVGKRENLNRFEKRQAKG